MNLVAFIGGGAAKGGTVTWILFWGFTLLFGLFLLFVILSLMSRHRPELGLSDAGRLAACPATPNCVCSEVADSAAYVEPLRFADAPQSAWARAEAAVKAAGGNVEQHREGYLWATFATPVLRFIDDVELRLAAEEGVIHVRSASRVGFSDLGVNRRRVVRLRRLFQ